MKTVWLSMAAILAWSTYAGCGSSESDRLDARRDLPSAQPDGPSAEASRSGTGGMVGTGGRLATGGTDGPVETGGVLDAPVVDAPAIDAQTHPDIDPSYGACTSDNDCTLAPFTGCCGGCYAASDPLPPSMPCSSTCPAGSPNPTGFRAYTCACVNGRCSQGTMPAGSPCDPARDLCVNGTKCCSACAGSSADGAVCAAAVCTKVSLDTISPVCPGTSVDGG